MLLYKSPNGTELFFLLKNLIAGASERIWTADLRITYFKTSVDCIEFKGLTPGESRQKRNFRTLYETIIPTLKISKVPG